METVKQNARLRRILSFLVPVAFCTAFIFALFFGMLYAFDVFPFSDRTMSQYDLLAQIVPYAEHLFDVAKGEASLFYSTRVGGGMDVFGTLVYCLLSPFTFLFFLFGEGNVYYAASVILPVKLACIAAAAVVLIRVRFPDMHVLLTIPVALLYAFCGYMFVSNTYINWMDLLIYMPLGVLAFGHMRRTGRVRWFALVIAACIYTCFSLTCFSMFISYPVFAAYGFLAVDKTERRNYLFKMSLAYFCGVVAALPVMVPALLAFLRSGRSGGIFSFLSSEIGVSPYLSKFSYIFSDSLFVLLVLVYFVKTRFRTKESRFLGVAGLFIMLPVLVDECCMLMNMGYYLSYSLRFGFLNAVYELYIACLVLEKVRFDGRTRFLSAAEGELSPAVLSAPLYADDPSGVQKTYGMPAPKGKDATRAAGEEGGKEGGHAATKALEKKLRRAYLAEGGLAVLLAALALFGVAVVYEVYCVVRGLDGVDLGFWGGLSSWVDSVRDLSTGFSSSFAHSLGGLGAIAVLFFVVALVAVPAMFFHKFRLVRLKFIYPCLAVVLFAQVCFYGSQLVCGNLFNPVRYQEYNSLYERFAAEAEEEHSRVKDYGAYLSDNQPLITDSSSYSLFSSVADRGNYAANLVFGYGFNGVNALKSRGGTVFGDCLLGYKYYFFQTENGASLEREYLKKAAQEEHFAMYENTLVFPSAFTVSSSGMSVTPEYDFYFKNMQYLYEFLGGEGEVFTTFAISPSDVSYVNVTDEETGETVRTVFVKVRIRESGDASFYSELPLDKGIRYYTSTISDSRDISSVKTYTYHDADPGRYYYMYLYSTDEDYELTAEEVIEKCSVKFITVDTLRSLSQKLWERAQTYTVENSLLSTSYRASVTAGEGEYLFLNSVAVRGMKAYVNGKEVGLIDNGLNMILVPLSAGENEVEIVYTSAYPLYGGVTVLFSAAALAAVAFVLKKKENWVRAIEKPVAVLSVGLAAAVVAVFMVVPTVAFLVKLLGLVL